jgi:alpha-beta hydrolase superfamily lysophospholipase
VEIGGTFSAKGIAVIRYDHQGCGESEGDLSATTVSSRIKDLEAIVDLAVQHPLLCDHLGLLGSSMGGFISILKGASDARVQAAVLWATPARLEGVKNEAEEEGLLQEGFYHDAKKYDAEKTIRRLNNCLLLHGEADEIVPLSQAEDLYQAAQAPKHLEIFPGVDHRFTNPKHRQRAIQMSLAWFQQYL